MTQITYSTLTTLLGDTSIAASLAEEIIDFAVNKINSYGRMYGIELPNMAGTTAGAKTLTCESPEAGAIISVAVVAYNNIYRQAGSQTQSQNTGSVSSNSSASMLEDLAREMAEHLRDLDVSVG